MTHYCLGFLFSNCGSHPHVVLIRKNKPEWQAGKLNGVGGKLEYGETPLDAMRREFREETSVDVEVWTPVAEMAFPGDVVVHVFSAQDSLKAALCRTTTEEQIEVVDSRRTWDLIPNLRWLIPMSWAALVDKTFKPLYIEENP